ncbi:hypothetical protein Acsp01_33060 [Actinoplanes sp. NBRC 101535]|nr:hypothetical protein Acsp01_33060 [Actinoplanes sp. NBRC 101535]
MADVISYDVHGGSIMNVARRLVVTAACCAAAVALQPTTTATAAPPGTVSRTPAAATAPEGKPHPSLSGRRLQLPGDGAVYLVDPEGYRRWIPDPETYDNLFRGRDDILMDLHLDLIAHRAALTSGAYLARVPDTVTFYLVSNNTKRRIASPETMDKYQFNGDKARPGTPELLAGLPDGPLWQ